MSHCDCCNRFFGAGIEPNAKPHPVRKEEHKLYYCDTCVGSVVRAHKEQSIGSCKECLNEWRKK